MRIVSWALLLVIFASDLSAQSATKKPVPIKRVTVDQILAMSVCSIYTDTEALLLQNANKSPKDTLKQLIRIHEKRLAYWKDLYEAHLADPTLSDQDGQILPGIDWQVTMFEKALARLRAVQVR